ncbi:uncharacterized protein LOC113777745 [Coffea eugenioides]|uniref:uncharacterized protein LOC113777745 n=1 Tax=Coffea eugenioides TaxID=49369 RepID=UPI000F60BE23|nr:uncharacterized protein LOC113777745 [Coffea eugenioides]
MISSHSFSTLNVCGHNSITRYFHIPKSSSSSYFFSLRKHSFEQTKLKFCNLSAKYGVKRVMCSSSTDHQEPKAPTPQKSDMPDWKKWTVGIVFSIILPAVGHKMGPLMLLKSKVDMVIEKVDEVTEVVEDIAEAAVDVVETVEEKLPEDSKLRDEVHMIKDLAEKAVDKAKQADELLDQIKDVEDKFMESLNGPERNEAEKEPSNKDVDRSVKA